MRTWLIPMWAVLLALLPGIVAGVGANVGVTADEQPSVKLHLKGVAAHGSGHASLAHLSPDQPLRLAIRLEPGHLRGVKADCWLTAQTPFGPYSFNRYGWYAGEFRAGAFPLRRLRSYTVLRKDMLPPGEYVFTACVDDNADNVRDCTWQHELTVVVQ